jgi:hypothetical protein
MPILILRRLSPNYREKQRLASRLDAAREIQRSPPPHAAPIVKGRASLFATVPVLKLAAIISKYLHQLGE